MEVDEESWQFKVLHNMDLEPKRVDYSTYPTKDYFIFHNGIDLGLIHCIVPKDNTQARKARTLGILHYVMHKLWLTVEGQSMMVDWTLLVEVQA